MSCDPSTPSDVDEFSAAMDAAWSSFCDHVGEAAAMQLLDEAAARLEPDAPEAWSEQALAELEPDDAEPRSGGV